MTLELADKILQGVMRELPDTPHHVVVLICQIKDPMPQGEILANVDLAEPAQRLSIADWIRRNGEVLEQGLQPPLP